MKGISLLDIRSLAHFADDLQDSAYSQHRYTFIEPNFGASFLSRQDGAPGPRYTGGSSQHPEDDMYGGEALIKHVYEAIRNSPLWNTSLLVIVYDEHGGFYDSVAPGAAPSPDDMTEEQIRSGKLNKYGFDFAHYGPRVPAVVVSPLIPRGTVDHTLYDHTSILRTLGRWLDLAPLTCRDAAGERRAAPAPWPVARRRGLPEDTGRTGSTGARRRQGRSGAATDADDALLPETGNAAGFLHVLLKAELERAGPEPGRGERIVEEFTKMTSPSHVRAYVERMWHEIVR